MALTLRMRTAAGLIACLLALGGREAALACTAFCATGAGQVLVGNNEDWNNPHTKLWFVPATAGAFGRMYVGFDDLWPQGGMNERGLWFDGFAVPQVEAKRSAHLPQFGGNLIDKAMAECSTVEEVIGLFSQYNRGFLSGGILMFADASGDAISIEADAIVRKTGPHFVQTNFHQSRGAPDPNDRRFATASTMLKQAGADISVDLFRKILAATRQKGPAPTLYSNVYELRSRTMHLYYFHDFDHVVTLRLADELAKGARTVDIPSLFPRNAAAEKYAERRRGPAAGAAWPAAAAFIAVPCAVFAIGVVTFIRAGRRGRIILSVAALGMIATLALGVAGLHTQRNASRQFSEFSIGPAAGRGANINSAGVRASGITLKSVIGVAYDVPAVRIVAPSWLDDARYALTASVPPESAHAFRSLLQEELKARLRLETHFEVRPFDVLILTASGAPRFEAGGSPGPSIWIHDTGLVMQGASLEAMGSALQGVLRRPVINETGITDTYDAEFDWGEDRLSSITAALKGYGVQLTPAKRDMEVLVVDGIRREPALALIGEISRLTSAAPPQVRQPITELFSMR